MSKNNIQYSSARDHRLPLVSILIPTLNEENYIRRCLDSVLGNDYPSEHVEIIIIDGCSSDKTTDIVKQYQAKSKNISLLENPKTNTPAGLNIGIKAASGDILIWLGAHAKYDSDYIRLSVENLIDTGASSVGGVITPVGEGVIGQIIAYAARNPFGVGNAKYRNASRPMWVDTVFGGCWRKSDVTKIGGFNEEFKTNQDSEFNYRLRKKISGIYLNPIIHCDYYVTNSLYKLAKQYYRYGIWRTKTILLHPGSLELRQLAPPLFLITLITSLFSAPLTLVPLSVLSSVYFLIAYFAAFKNKRDENLLTIILSPIVFLLMHLSWGTGFIVGMASHLSNKSVPRSET